MSRVLRSCLTAALVAAAALLAAPAGANSLPAGSIVLPPVESGPPLLHADIFRDCVQVNGRWRCRSCRFVRHCGRSGCQWVEQCRWGPPVSPYPQ
jgi:hypothetical protein